MTAHVYTGFLLRAETPDPQALIEAFKATFASEFAVTQGEHVAKFTTYNSASIPNGIENSTEVMLMAQPGLSRIILRSWGPVQGKSIPELLQALQPLAEFLDLSTAQGYCIVDNNDPDNEDEPTPLTLPESWGGMTVAPYVPFHN